MAKKTDLERVEKKLRTLIERVLKTGEVVLNPYSYGVSCHTDVDGRRLSIQLNDTHEEFGICLLGLVIMYAIKKSRRKRLLMNIPALPYWENRAVAQILGITVGNTQSLENGFFPGSAEKYSDEWSNLGLRLRQDYRDTV